MTESKTPSMRTPALSTVYVDNQPVGLMGDPFPPVAKILAAVGRHAELVRVERVPSSSAARGTPVALEDVIDRTLAPTQPIYLTCTPKAGEDAGDRPRGHFIAWPVLSGPAPRPRGPLPRRGEPARPGQGEGRPGDTPEWDL